MSTGSDQAGPFTPKPPFWERPAFVTWCAAAKDPAATGEGHEQEKEVGPYKRVTKVQPVGSRYVCCIVFRGKG
jgi:hypothetical protein